MKTDVTYRNYERIRNEHGITSDYRVSKETGVPTYKLSRWKVRGFVLKYPDMKAVADFLDVSVDEIYGKGDVQ